VGFLANYMVDLKSYLQNTEKGSKSFDLSKLSKYG